MFTEKTDRKDFPEKRRKLTILELKQFKGFENIGNDEAEIIAEELYQLSLLCYEIQMNKQTKKDEYGTGKV